MTPDSTFTTGPDKLPALHYLAASLALNPECRDYVARRRQIVIWMSGDCTRSWRHIHVIIDYRDGSTPSDIEADLCVVVDAAIRLLDEPAHVQKGTLHGI